MKKYCKDCKHYRFVSSTRDAAGIIQEEYGECTRKPPIFIGGDFEDANAPHGWAHPMVWPKDRCSHFLYRKNNETDN